MGNVRRPPLVTPLVAMLSQDGAAFEQAREPLMKLLGAIDIDSPVYPFDVTEYYSPTMGANLKRKFFAFEELADAAELPRWKLATNALELELAEILRAEGGPQRPINLDCGYITGAKLVLASTKDFAHRIYLRDGIFAELTLSFRKDRWAGHDLTFPDFKSGRYDEFLRKVRDWHIRKLKSVMHE